MGCRWKGLRLGIISVLDGGDSGVKEYIGIAFYRRDGNDL